uniref:Uncharacterized protein n=1 Tax=Poecilia latipinna TaxID=48699 RepID=A0A3B3U1L8_9TELE
MGIYAPVICTLLYVVLDSVITTVLYIKGTELSLFIRDVLDFNILSSALDLWGIVLLRASLLLGASIGVLWNREDGPPRVARVTTVILLFCMVVITYTLVKLLMLTEVEPLNRQPCFLSLMGWTCASSLGVVLLWRQLGRVSSSASGLEVRNSRGGGGRKEKVSSRATLGRLLSYCRKDTGLLSLAVLFLLISAVCEAFIPLYYGKAIDSIVVHQSMEYFAKPVATLASLALSTQRKPTLTQEEHTIVQRRRRLVKN